MIRTLATAALALLCWMFITLAFWVMLACPATTWPPLGNWVGKGPADQAWTVAPSIKAQARWCHVNCA